MSDELTLSDGDLAGFLSDVQRSEKRAASWRREYRLYQSLGANGFQAYNSIAPGGDQTGVVGRSMTSTVVRNAIGQNVEMKKRRLAFKNPKMTGAPLLSSIEVDGVMVDGNVAAYTQGELVTYAWKTGGFTDELTLGIDDACYANSCWMKMCSVEGADAPETRVWPYVDGKGGKKVGAKAPVSLANYRFPVWVHCDIDDVITDPDVKGKRQGNWVAHRIRKPLSQMRTQMDGDEKRYKNLEGLSGNLKVYRDEANAGERTGDPRNWEEEGLKWEGSDDDLVYYEMHRRIPCDSELARKMNGGETPKTSDGHFYFMVCFVEEKGQSKTGITCIRKKVYPADVGGFLMREWKPMLTPRSSKGWSNIRNYYEASALENYWMSYVTHWLANVKPQKVVDSTMMDPADFQKMNQHSFWAAVLATPSSGRSAREAVTITDFHAPPPEAFSMAQIMRSVGEEAAGSNANQRGAYSGSDASATEAEIVQRNANEQVEYEVESLKAYVESMAQATIMLLDAMLPDGEFEIPGSDGAFHRFDRVVLKLACAFALSYQSMIREDDPVKAKGVQNFMMQVGGTPPNLWAAFRPLWRYQATSFSPGLLSAYREFEKIAFGEQASPSPDAIHLKLREGVMIEPDPNQDFVTTIPQHEKMLAQITTDPSWAGWMEPAGESGQIPMKLLAYYIKLAKDIASKKGLGPMLGLTGDQAGAPRKDRGSGAGSGRVSQGVPGVSGESVNVTEDINVA